MNVGTLTISLTARTAALMSSLGKVRTFENGILASVQRMNRNISTVGQSLSVLSLPLVALGGLAIKTFADFEYALAKTTGLAGVAAKQVQAWTGDVLHLARKTGESAKELAEALYFVASSGIHGTKVLETLEVAAYGAMAGLGETKDIANLLTSVMNAYGIANVDTAKTMDILIAAVREGKAEADEMAKSLGMVVNVAAEMGISFENVASAVAATTRTGVSANTSATQLRQFLFSFVKERPMVEKALNSMGLSFEQVRKDLSEDLLTGLIKLRAVTSAWGDAALSKVIPNVRAFNEALSLTGVNVIETMKLFKAIKTPTNDFAEAVAAVENTTKVKFNKAMQTINTSLISFGATIADKVIVIVERFTTLIGNLVNWFTSLDSGTQNLIITVTALSAVLGPMLLVMSGFVNTLFSMAGALFTPLGVIVAIGAAVALVVRNFETWEKAWPRIVEQMKKGGLWILKIVNAIAQAVFGTFNDILKFVVTLGGVIPNKLGDKFDEYTQNMEDRGKEIQNTIDGINDSLNGFSPEQFIKRYQRLLKEMGGIHPKQKNSLMSIIKRTTAASMTAREYNPEMIKADPKIAYGFTDALGDSLKKEGKGILDWITDFGKQLGAKFGAIPKLNIGEGNTLALEYAKNKEPIENYMALLKEYVSFQAELTKAFGGFGLIVGGAMIASLADLESQLDNTNKKLTYLLDNAKTLGELQALRDMIQNMPPLLKSLLDPETLALYFKIIDLKSQAIIDADAKLKKYTNTNWELQNAGEQVLDVSNSLIAAWAKLGAVSDLTGGAGMSNLLGSESKDELISYWETIKQQAENFVSLMRQENIDFQIPENVQNSYNIAVENLNKLKNLKFNEVIDISSGILSSTESLVSFGDTIKNVFEDGKLSFSEFINVLQSGLSAIVSIANTIELVTTALTTLNGVKQISTAVTNADTTATMANAVAKKVEAVAATTDAAAQGADTVATEINTAAKITNAIASAIKWLVETLGPIGLFAAIGAVAGIISMATRGKNQAVGAAKMAEGGIVPSGYNNDTFPAMLSSHEAVIPLKRLPQLMGISQNEGNREVVFRIDGKQLVGVLTKQSKTYNAF